MSVIWDPSVPFPSSAEAPLLTGVTFHVIKPYEPEVDGYKWLHGATIVRHKGTWFMTWGHNKGRENSLGEVAQGRRSTDDFATLTPVEMIAPGTPTDAHSHGVTLSLNGNFWGFFGLSKGSRKGNRAEAFKLNETTDQWESQGIVMDKGFWPYTEPKRMDNGNYITAGFRMNVENGSPPAVAISNGEDMTDWTVIRIPKPDGLNDMWETCMTMNDSWGFNQLDANWKSAEQIASHFKDITQKGGCLLLNVGPTGEGAIPEPSISILQQLHEFIAKQEKGNHEM